MDKDAKEIVVMALIMIFGVVGIVIAVTVYNVDNVVAGLVGFAIIMVLIFLFSYFSGYGRQEYNRMSIDEKEVESKKDGLIREECCPRCGAAIDFGKKYCSHCGKDLEEK